MYTPLMLSGADHGIGGAAAARAVSERRRYHGLRVATVDFLAQIRHLNKVATSMRAGLLDVDEAAAEIAATERRLHDMVSRSRELAGVAA